MSNKQVPEVPFMLESMQQFTRTSAESAGVTPENAPFVLDRDMQQFTRMPSVPDKIEPDKNGRRIVYPEPESSSLPTSDRASKFPLFVPSQNFVVFNLANRQQNPKCAGAGYRILGLFSTLDQARSYVGRNFSSPDINVFTSSTHQLEPICESEHDQSDVLYRQNVIDVITTKYADKIERHRQEFEENLREQKTGAVGQSEFAKAQKSQKVAQEAVQEAVQEKKTEPQQLTAQCQLLNQNYSVVIHFLDTRESVGKKEPLFSVLAAFGNLVDAAEYARTTAAKQYPKCTIDVVDNYQWLFPMSVNPEDILEEYGCTQLNDIMAGRKQNIRSCQEYERSRAGDEKKPI